MKNFLLCITLFLITISCSSDFDSQTDNSELNLFESADFPANPLNPMDKKGQEYYKQLELYLKDNKSPNSAIGIADQLRFISGSTASSQSTTSKGLINFTDELVESIISDPDNSLILIVQNSSLSAVSKNNLISFLQNLMSQRDLDFSVLYAFIISYEADTSTDSAIIQVEKDTLLTVASISRYSLYSAEERKDRDWETSVGNKPARNLLKSSDAAMVSVIALLDGLL